MKITILFYALNALTLATFAVNAALRESNAQRFARGLPPLPPRRHFGQREHFVSSFFCFQNLLIYSSLSKSPWGYGLLYALQMRDQKKLLLLPLAIRRRPNRREPSSYAWHLPEQLWRANCLELPRRCCIW
jgi:hypothetical protein